MIKALKKVISNEIDGKIDCCAKLKDANVTSISGTYNETMYGHIFSQSKSL